MIFGEFREVRVFLRPGVTDMRKQINGLATLAQEALREDPFSGSLFVFCNRRRDQVRIVYWDRNGFCMWQKRLERDRFPWPAGADAAREVSREELLWLLNGIDFTKAHGTRKYSVLA